MSDEGQVGEARILLDPLYKKVITPEQVRTKQYKNQLQEYAFNKSMGLKMAVIRGQQNCPVFGDKIGKAYLQPVPDWDRRLKQQWQITRKDYRGRNVNLFCYPDGEFDGVDFNSEDPNNQPVDLDMYTYVSEPNVEQSLKQLGELFLSNSTLSLTEKKRAEITNTIAKLQTSSPVNDQFETALKELAKKFATCQKYAAISSLSRRSDLTLSKARSYLEPLRNAVQATVALDGAEDKDKVCQRASANHITRVYNGVTVDTCFPQPVADKLEADTDLANLLERKKIRKALEKYAQEAAVVMESEVETDMEDTFFKLTKTQKRII